MNQPVQFGPGHAYRPNHPTTATYMAACQTLGAEKFSDAIEQFEAEPADSPCRGLALSLGAEAALRLGKFDRAIQIGNAAIQHYADNDCPFNPIGVGTYRTVANALAKSDRVALSYGVFQKGLEAADGVIAHEEACSDPEERKLVELEKAHLLTDFGGALLRRQQPGAAIAQLQLARPIYSKHPSASAGRPIALTNLAMAFHFDGKPYQAEQALQEALSVPNLTSEQLLEINLLQVRFGLLDSATSERVIKTGVESALAGGRHETACARLAGAIAAAAENKDMPRALELLEWVAKIEPLLPADSLIPVKLSFYHALARRDNGAPVADYFPHLMRGAHDWCGMATHRLSLADFQDLARTMHDHFRLLCRVLVDQGKIPESFIAFEMGRSRAYAAELNHDASHPILAINPFHGDHITLEQLETLQRGLPTDGVLVCLGTIPPDLAAYVVSPNEIRMVTVPLSPKIVESLADLPSRLQNDEGAAAVDGSILELAKKVKEVAGERKILGVIPHRIFHTVPWRAVFKSVGMSWDQLPFVVLFSPFFWRKPDPLSAKCFALGYGVACNGAKSVDLVKEAEDFSAVFGSNGQVHKGTKARLEDALAFPHIVLLSCHGTLEKTNLGPQTKFKLSDGVFELSEAMPDQRTPASMVILSACDSGAYETLEGDYPIGAAPSLLLAGAAHCACARFPVDAAFTKDFFCAFGRQLRSRVPPGEAFAAAMGEAERQKYDFWRHLSCLELLARGK